MGKLEKFPHVSKIFDENEMVALNFNQLIDEMIARFGVNFTKQIFKVAVKDKTSNRSKRKASKVNGY